MSDNVIKHRYELKMEIGFHDLKDIYMILKNISFNINSHFSKNDQNFNSVSGSPMCGSEVNCEFNKEITKESFFKQIDERANDYSYAEGNEEKE